MTGVRENYNVIYEYWPTIMHIANIFEKDIGIVSDILATLSWLVTERGPLHLVKGLRTKAFLEAVRMRYPNDPFCREWVARCGA